MLLFGSPGFLSEVLETAWKAGTADAPVHIRETAYWPANYRLPDAPLDALSQALHQYVCPDGSPAVSDMAITLVPLETKVSLKDQGYSQEHCEAYAEICSSLENEVTTYEHRGDSVVFPTSLEYGDAVALVSPPCTCVNLAAYRHMHGLVGESNVPYACGGCEPCRLALHILAENSFGDFVSAPTLSAEEALAARNKRAEYWREWITSISSTRKAARLA